MDQREELPRAELKTVAEKTIQIQVMELLQQASGALTRASALAEQANPMCSSVPVFGEMKVVAKQITAMMQQVAKVRGLG